MIDIETGELIIDEIIEWKRKLKNELNAGHLSAFALNFVESCLENFTELEKLFAEKTKTYNSGFKMLEALVGSEFDKNDLIKKEKIRLTKHGEAARRELNNQQELAGNVHLVVLEMEQMIKDFNGK